MKRINMSGTMIPPVAFGTWSWGTGKNGGDRIFGNHFDFDELLPVFAAGKDAGYDLWDTAMVYAMGESERILAQCIAEKGNVILSTKFTPMPNQEDGALEDMLFGSLSRFGREYIDLYWIHNAADVEKWTRAVIPYLRAGTIRSIGVSNHDLNDIKLAQSILAAEGFRVSAVQNHYSLLYRDSERAGIIDWCKENDAVFFPYMVLEQGALTGRFTPEQPFPDRTNRAKAFPPERLGQIAPLIEVMTSIGEKYSIAPAQVAIAHAVSKGMVPVIGVTKTSHVDSAVQAAEVVLTAEEIQLLEKAADDTGISVRAVWEKPV